MFWIMHVYVYLYVHHMYVYIFICRYLSVFIVDLSQSDSKKPSWGNMCSKNSVDAQSHTLDKLEESCSACVYIDGNGRYET